MKIKIALLLCFFGFFNSYSQEVPILNNDKNDIIDSLFEQNQIIDELLASISKYQFLYLTVNYNNDTYFSGRDIGLDQFNLNPRMTYLHYSGIYASVSGIYYDKFDPKWDLTTTSIGYGKSFGKNKTYKYATSYSKYFYNNGVDNSFTNDLTISFGLKNKKRTLSTVLSGTYLFGNDQSFQIVSNSSATIKLLKLKKINLDLKPQLAFIAGKQTVELARTYVSFGTVNTYYEENDIFSLFNTQLSLPLQLRSNSFDLEVGYNINFPTAIGDEQDLKNTNFINISLSYLFNL